MGEEYRVVRSRRRSVSLQIGRDGELIVRAPYLTPEREIRRIVESHRDWISRHKSLQEKRSAAHPEPTEAEKKETQA